MTISTTYKNDFALGKFDSNSYKSSFAHISESLFEAGHGEKLRLVTNQNNRRVLASGIAAMLSAGEYDGDIIEPFFRNLAILPFDIQRATVCYMASRMAARSRASLYDACNTYGVKHYQVLSLSSLRAEPLPEDFKPKNSARHGMVYRSFVVNRRNGALTAIIVPFELGGKSYVAKVYSWGGKTMTCSIRLEGEVLACALGEIPPQKTVRDYLKVLLGFTRAWAHPGNYIVGVGERTWYKSQDKCGTVHMKVTCI